MTLNSRILGDIEGRILSGEWPPGFRLPFEVDLASDYGCSRMTVNKVMTQLVSSGLIERRKKSGSFVTRPSTQSAVLEIRDIEAEVKALGFSYSYVLLDRKVRQANTEDRKLLELTDHERIVDLFAVHKAAKRPFCIEERRINCAAVPSALEEPFSEAPPGQWLLRQVPWSTAEHRIRAIAAPKDIAHHLDVPPGAACLSVERRTWNSQGPITWVRLTYPGDSQTLVARFTPASV